MKDICLVALFSLGISTSAASIFTFIFSFILHTCLFRLYHLHRQTILYHALFVECTLRSTGLDHTKWKCIFRKAFRSYCHIASHFIDAMFLLSLFVLKALFHSATTSGAAFTQVRLFVAHLTVNSKATADKIKALFLVMEISLVHWYQMS